MSYYARIINEGDHFSVSFPQFENINTYGDSVKEALLNAEEALNACVESDFERGYEIPTPQIFKGNEFHEISLQPHIQIAIELHRIRNHRSQFELAKQLGVSYQAYQRLEDPKGCNPTIKTLEKISKVLNKKLEIVLK